VGIARESQATWPILIDALENTTHDDVRGSIAVGIPGIGVPALPLLQRSLIDPNPRIRGCAMPLSYTLDRWVPGPQRQLYEAIIGPTEAGPESIEFRLI
jgi:hypothetical protein